MSTSCPFCGTDIQDRIIEQTDHSIVFLADPSMIKGHILIIPKRHVWQPWEVSHEEYIDMIELQNRYRQKIEKVFGHGSDIRQQYRPFVDDGPVHNVRHYHIHILPRSLNDEIYDAEEYISRPLSDAEASSLIQELR